MIGSILAPSNELGVYLHFPWCLHKCSYCDFFSIGLLDNADPINPDSPVFRKSVDAYIKTIKRELELRFEIFQDFKTIRSIFFGGGTASLLTPDALNQLIEIVASFFTFSDSIEITLEGNPENFTKSYLDEIFNTKINRVNVGIQTWHKNHLQQMNRFYSDQAYATILDNLEQSNFVDIGADLIYGFPGQSKQEFQDDLEKILKTRLNHISIYSLTMEKNTKYFSNYKLGHIQDPDENLQLDIFNTLPAIMSSAGFLHYEVSNYAKDGRVSRHNMGYWMYEPYLGLGPGAHGFSGTQRYSNSRNIQAWHQNQKFSDYSTASFVEEFISGYLRLCIPLDPLYIACFYKNSHDKILQNLTRTFDRWVDSNWMTKQVDGFYQWTVAGLLFLDDHILELVEVLDRLGDHFDVDHTDRSKYTR